jgi:hypothetical protein
MGVGESAVRADEQHAGMASLAAGRRWRDPVDGDADAEGAERVVHHGRSAPVAMRKHASKNPFGI